jgi:hypothetical protein
MTPRFEKVFAESLLKFRPKDFIPIKGYLNYCDRNIWQPKAYTMQDLILGGYNLIITTTGTLIALELASKLMGLQGKL